jgi:hypothetical protein
MHPGYGSGFAWESLDGRRVCRIAAYRPGSIDDPSSSIEEYHKWAIDHVLRFEKVFVPQLVSVATQLTMLLSGEKWSDCASVSD